MNNYPNIAIDVVLFSYIENKLNVLLLKRKIEPYVGKYVLPGVFLNDGETAEEAAIRALIDETNIEININYLEQLYTYTNTNRDPRGRVISISYYGLVNQSNYDIICNSTASNIDWWDYNKFPQLFTKESFGFDHYNIIHDAFKRLRGKLQYEPIGLDLLPIKFKIGDLYNIYCTVLQKKIDRRNFIRKLMSYELLVETNDKSTGHVGRKAKLYKFNNEKYKLLKERGLYFEI